jgi:hypothetical protein
MSLSVSTPNHPSFSDISCPILTANLESSCRVKLIVGCVVCGAWGSRAGVRMDEVHRNVGVKYGYLGWVFFENNSGRQVCKIVRLEIT